MREEVETKTYHPQENTEISFRITLFKVLAGDQYQLEIPDTVVQAFPNGVFSSQQAAWDYVKDTLGLIEN